VSDRLQRLAEDRSARNAARDIFHANLKNVVEDFETRGIGERIADRATREARELGGKVFAIAEQSKGVIAGVTAALVVWLCRERLMDWVSHLIGNEPADTDVQPEDSANA
jgi:hypothetical protein